MRPRGGKGTIWTFPGTSCSVASALGVAELHGIIEMPAGVQVLLEALERLIATSK